MLLSTTPPLSAPKHPKAGHHGLGPVHHRREHEAQGVLSQLQTVAVLHLVQAVGDAVEALHHLESLLVADDFHVGIVLLEQCHRAAVVGFHVVNHQIVDRSVAYGLAYVLEKLHEEVHFDGVDEHCLVVADKVGVVGNAVGQWPQALEELLVAVVDTHIMDAGSNGCCHIKMLCLSVYK